MAFQVSPGVQVKEIDLTSLIPAVSATRAGFCGQFNWGPVEQITTINSVNQLREIFATPDNQNYISWWSAANFLAYSNSLQVVRVVGSGALNAASSGTGVLVKNRDDYDEKDAAGSLGSNVFIGKFPGGLSGDTTSSYGNSFQVSVCDRTSTNVTLFDGVSGGFGLTSEAAPNANTTTYFFTLPDSPRAFGLSGDVNLTIANTGTTAGDKLNVGGLVSRTITGYTAPQFTTITATTHTHSTGREIFINLSTGVTPGNVAGMSGGVVKLFGSTGGSPDVAIFGTVRSIVSTQTNGITIGVTFGSAFDGAYNVLGGVTLAVGSTVEFLGAIQVGSSLDSQSGVTSGAVEWRYADQFDIELPDSSENATDVGATNDLVHVVVVDEDGFWTGTNGEVIEKFSALSKASNAKSFDGTGLFYKNRINDGSEYVYWAGHTDVVGKGGLTPLGAVNGAATSWGTILSNNVNYGLLPRPVTVALSGGTAPPPTDFITNGYDKFSDTETVDINILVGGGVTGANAVSVSDIATNRKDAIAFFSPPSNAVLDSTGSSPLTAAKATANAVAYRKGTNGNLNGGSVNFESGGNLNVNTSYSVLDSGWKYIFDRYNDVFRYVPLNADIAGVPVRTDVLGEPWFSPAGFNRGQLQGVVKLAYSPTQSQRDDLYTSQINPVVSFPGQGTVLFGDKTLQTKPSAFDRINVRRLFIILEKAISTAAKFQLFEINDAFTRSQFRTLVEPFLRDVQARRGIEDFKVICDESNNTSSVIDRNEFVASIFIKPTRSINFITLNFIATSSGVNFEEIGG